MPPEDWDLLFHAVGQRLRHCVQDPAVLPLRAQVEDCVQALELLHAALEQERGYVRRLENQLRETCAALAAARAEATQATPDRAPPGREQQTGYAWGEDRAGA